MVKHAYRDGETGEIVVRYTVAEGDALDRGRGHGPGFEPERARRRRPERRRHGMGLMIIRVLSDELNISSTSAGTRLAFVKRFSPES